MIKIADKIALPNAIFDVPSSWAKENINNAVLIQTEKSLVNKPQQCL